MTDRTKTLEQEAVVFKEQRGQMVWRLYASGMCTDEMIGDRWTPEVACVPPQQFLASFIAAATAREQEIEKLRKRVAELERMVPRWVLENESALLNEQGWSVSETDKLGNGPRLWLMVPPIPLPEGE